ncbi:hypothetical protein AVEN_228660-1 [Araneus ventricosus]|uniref:Uncharacterized protein n=1 Tax=Araneus ventricosus TaxID=182803 RepID=A0A4Y2P5P8_ARAVE|nr:hypothetical protein AVEN_228660-1 [Araneus ventricosus]
MRFSHFHPLMQNRYFHYIKRLVTLVYPPFGRAPTYSRDSEGVDFDRMALELSKKNYNARLQSRVISATSRIRDIQHFKRDGPEDSIQQLRQRMGEWYEFNLHHNVATRNMRINLVTLYNNCLGKLGLESEFEINDDGISHSDRSSAASPASDRSEINDAVVELNPRNETFEQASNCKDNSMVIEHSVNPSDTNVKSNDIANNVIGETANSVIVNNCNVIDKTKAELPECNADAEIMNIDSPVGKSVSAENNGYQTQGRKRGRVPSNESIPSKKLTRSNSLPLQNKFNALANLPDTENIKEIYHLTSLSYHFITVEPFENRHSHQCFNCQMWNHRSKGCDNARTHLTQALKEVSENEDILQMHGFANSPNLNPIENAWNIIERLLAARKV